MPNAGGLDYPAPPALILWNVLVFTLSYFPHVFFFLSFVFIFYLVVLDRILELNGYPRDTYFF